MKFIYQAFLVSVFCTSLSETCRFPPSLWCSSREIAKECKVLKQCHHILKAKPASAPPVSYALYYESLCPDCQDHFRQQLGPTFKEIGSIIDLALVPYGNAEEERKGGKYIFTCQHGHEECVGNLIETCSIYLLKKTKAYFPFVHCMEISSKQVTESAHECAKSMGIDVNPILECANGTMGNRLEHKMAKRTDSLKPQHEYVPWVTLNGVHNDKIQKEAMADLKKLICDTYEGKKPPACDRKHYNVCHKSFKPFQ